MNNQEFTAENYDNAIAVCFRRPTLSMNPEARGKGLGRAWLHHAIRLCKELGAKTVTLNTCDADHPRALNNYLKAGFRVVRESVETWPIPRRLNIPIHEGLRV